MNELPLYFTPSNNSTAIVGIICAIVEKDPEDFEYAYWAILVSCDEGMFFFFAFLFLSLLLLLSISFKRHVAIGYSAIQ